VAAHAVVVQRDEEGEIVWEETAWGDGCDGREFDEVATGRRTSATRRRSVT
jgi:hypothetical protein